jgi:hypothetical protein
MYEDQKICEGHIKARAALIRAKLQMYSLDPIPFPFTQPTTPAPRRICQRLVPHAIQILLGDLALAVLIDGPDELVPAAFVFRVPCGSADAPQ